MTRPKSFAEINQRVLVHSVTEWDGDDIAYINVPLSRKPVLVAIDNQGPACDVSIEHNIRTDPANATATIGDVLVTYNTPGAQGNSIAISVIIPDGAEATDLDVDVIQTETAIHGIIVILAIDANGDPDDAKNTAAAVAALIDDLDDFSAEATGATVFDEVILPKLFTGGTVDIYALATVYEQLAQFVVAGEGDILPVAIGANERKVIGPIEMWPRWFGGRIVIEPATTPEVGDITIVQVLEG